MKSMNEYIFEKTGLTMEAQEFSNKMKEHFSFDKCSISKEGMKFENVCLKEDISYQNGVISKGEIFKNLDIRKNGWIVCENEDESYILMNHNINEAFVLPSIIPVGQPNTVGNYENFPNVNAIQMGAMADLQKVISTVKRLSIEDANHLKSIMGPSLEEKILRTIIDACLFDTPPANGQQNGV